MCHDRLTCGGGRWGTRLDNRTQVVTWIRKGGRRGRVDNPVHIPVPYFHRQGALGVDLRVDRLEVFLYPLEG